MRQPSTKQSEFTAALKDCNKDKNRNSSLIPGKFPELYNIHPGGTVNMERYYMNEAVRSCVWAPNVVVPLSVLVYS